MGLIKRTYTDNVTVITADNLNDIQDEIILNGANIGDLTELETTDKTDLVSSINEVKGDIPSVPSPSNANPQMDGTASAGVSGDYSRADHVHPSDTSRASASDMNNVIDALSRPMPESVTWEIGNINLIGVDETTSVRARTAGYISMDSVVSIKNGLGYYSYRFYDNSNNFTEWVDWKNTPSTPKDVITNPNSAKCRVVVKSEPQGSMTVEQVESLMSVLISVMNGNIVKEFEKVNEHFADYFAEPWQTGMYCNYDGQVGEQSSFSLAKINVENLDGASVTIHTWLNGYAGCPIMAKDETLLMRTSSSKLNSETECTFNVTLPVGCGYIYLTTLNSHKDEAYVQYNGQIIYPLNFLDRMVENIGKRVNGSATNPLFKIDNRPMFIDCFLTVGCIGDSLSSGESYYTDNGSSQSGLVDIYQHSWGQYLARMTGNTYYNFSQGGLSTKTWLTSQHATDCFDGNHNCTAYIIGLGQNDKNASYTIGTSADIDLANYNNNADTFYGSYGKIIQKIQEIVPKAKIFVCTDPLDGVENAGYNTAIRAMATIFSNVYVLDIRQYGRDMYYSSLIKLSNRNGHYNAIAYRLMASIIGSYISWLVEHNPTEFATIEFIGTQYSYTPA